MFLGYIGFYYSLLLEKIEKRLSYNLRANLTFLTWYADMFFLYTSMRPFWTSPGIAPLSVGENCLHITSP